MSLASEIRAELARQNKQSGDLAAELDMTRGQLSRRLNGHTPLKFSEVVHIADALGMKPEELVERATKRRDTAA